MSLWRCCLVVGEADDRLSGEASGESYRLSIASPSPPSTSTRSDDIIVRIESERVKRRSSMLFLLCFSSRFACGNNNGTASKLSGRINRGSGYHLCNGRGSSRKCKKGLQTTHNTAFGWLPKATRQERTRDPSTIEQIHCTAPIIDVM